MRDGGALESVYRVVNEPRGTDLELYEPQEISPCIERLWTSQRRRSAGHAEGDSGRESVEPVLPRGLEYLVEDDMAAVRRPLGEQIYRAERAEQERAVKPAVS